MSQVRMGDDQMALRQKYEELLSAFISFKSVSGDAGCASETNSCAAWVKALFDTHGFETKLFEGYGYPIVYARYDAGKPETALVYAHYDVQPADGAWLSDPFTLTEKDGRWFGRGTNDMKGLELIQMVAIFDLIERGELNYNVTFVIEGNEESDGGDMPRFIRDHRDLLRCDFLVVSDGQGKGLVPVMDTSLRGGFNAEIVFDVARSDQHSGLYGGVMLNALRCAVEITHRAMSLLDESAEEYVSNPLLIGLEDPPDILVKNAPPYDIAAFMNDTGGYLQRKWSQKEILDRLYFRPMIEPTGIGEGYIGPGFRNALAAKATVKLNVRLAPTQPGKVCREEFEKWLEEQLDEIAPAGTYDVQIEGGDDGVILWKTGDPHLERIWRSTEDVCGKKVYLRPCGASIPVMAHFDKELGVPIASLSIGNQDANIHGINENICIASVEQGLRIYKRIFSS